MAALLRSFPSDYVLKLLANGTDKASGAACFELFYYVTANRAGLILPVAYQKVIYCKSAWVTIDVFFVGKGALAFRSPERIDDAPIQQGERLFADVRDFCLRMKSGCK